MGLGHLAWPVEVLACPKIGESATIKFWTWYFSRATPKMVCKDCLEPGHGSCVEGEEQPVYWGAPEAQTGGGKWKPRVGGRPWARSAPYQGSRICRLYNTTGCSYTDCKFEHCCGSCRGKGPRGTAPGVNKEGFSNGGFSKEVSSKRAFNKWEVSKGASIRGDFSRASPFGGQGGWQRH